MYPPDCTAVRPQDLATATSDSSPRWP